MSIPFIEENDQTIARREHLDALRELVGNVYLNGLADRVTLRRADVRTDRMGRANLVLANLTGALLVAQASRLLDLVMPGGELVLSGFQPGETPLVETAFGAATSRARVTEGDWEALHLQIPT